MKVIWKGIISFGLVSIPVNLYSAINSQAVKFRLLHKKDGSPVRYRRFCEKENKEIEWKDVVKGFEVSSGNFFIFSKEELEKLKPEKTDSVEIIEFIDREQMDSIYFNSHYFVSPQIVKDKAFFLFKSVLQAANKIAIGRFIMREKEYIVAINSYKSGLLLTTLNYGYEVRNISDIDELKEVAKINEQEMKLARTLIEQLYNSDFEISKFKDGFREQLLEVIDKKQRGEIPRKKREVKIEPDLIKALRASLK
jgi:DNA end-binding protein Ku